MGGMGHPDSLPSWGFCGELINPTTHSTVERALKNYEYLQTCTERLFVFKSILFSLVTVYLLHPQVKVILGFGDRDLQCDLCSDVSVWYFVGGVESVNWLKGISHSMAQGEVEDLVIHLEESIELTSIESGICLIGAILANKTLNK